MLCATALYQRSEILYLLKNFSILKSVLGLQLRSSHQAWSSSLGGIPSKVCPETHHEELLCESRIGTLKHCCLTVQRHELCERGLCVLVKCKHRSKRPSRSLQCRWCINIRWNTLYLFFTATGPTAEMALGTFHSFLCVLLARSMHRPHFVSVSRNNRVNKCFHSISSSLPKLIISIGQRSITTSSKYTMNLLCVFQRVQTVS